MIQITPTFIVRAGPGLTILHIESEAAGSTLVEIQKRIEDFVFGGVPKEEGGLAEENDGSVKFSVATKDIVAGLFDGNVYEHLVDANGEKIPFSNPMIAQRADLKNGKNENIDAWVDLQVGSHMLMHVFSPDVNGEPYSLDDHRNALAFDEFIAMVDSISTSG